MRLAITATLTAPAALAERTLFESICGLDVDSLGLATEVRYHHRLNRSFARAEPRVAACVPMKLEEIAERLNCRLEGPPQLEILGVAGIEEATERELTFVSNPKYVSKIADSQAGAILVSPDVQAPGKALLICDNPYLAFARAIELFYQPPRLEPGIHPLADVDESAVIGEECSIGPFAVVSQGVCLGRRCKIYPHAVIYPHAAIGHDFVAHSHAVVREHVRIGNGVILQNGAVVGADGFGFAPDSQGRFEKMVQSGTVVLEDDVEIGAHVCIDRATVGTTRIDRGVKIDNLVQIGHGSSVGADTVLAAQVGLAGSTKVGKRVMLAGQVGVAGHLEIGDGVIATGKTGIGKSIEAGRKISGAPEFDSSLWRRNYLLMHDLPGLFRRVKQLSKRVDELSAQLQSKQEDEGSQE